MGQKQSKPNIIPVPVKPTIPQWIEALKVGDSVDYFYKNIQNLWVWLPANIIIIDNDKKELKVSFKSPGPGERQYNRTITAYASKSSDRLSKLHSHSIKYQLFDTDLQLFRVHATIYFDETNNYLIGQSPHNKEKINIYNIPQNKWSQQYGRHDTQLASNRYPASYKIYFFDADTNELGEYKVITNQYNALSTLKLPFKQQSGSLTKYWMIPTSKEIHIFCSTTIPKETTTNLESNDPFFDFEEDDDFDLSEPEKMYYHFVYYTNNNSWNSLKDIDSIGYDPIEIKNAAKTIYIPYKNQFMVFGPDRSSSIWCIDIGVGCTKYKHYLPIHNKYMFNVVLLFDYFIVLFYERYQYHENKNEDIWCLNLLKDDKWHRCNIQQPVIPTRTDTSCTNVLAGNCLHFIGIHSYEQKNLHFMYHIKNIIPRQFMERFAKILKRFVPKQIVISNDLNELICKYWVGI